MSGSIKRVLNNSKTTAAGDIYLDNNAIAPNKISTADVAGRVICNHDSQDGRRMVYMVVRVMNALWRLLTRDFSEHAHVEYLLRFLPISDISLSNIRLPVAAVLKHSTRLYLV